MARVPRNEPPARAPFWLWTPVGVYAAAIFGLSALPQPGAMPGGVSDSTMHAAVYAGFCLVIVRALSAGLWSRVTPWRVAAAALAATAYGVTDEIHQLFVPGRFFEVRDMLADALGAACAAAAALLAARVASTRRPRASRSSP